MKITKNLEVEILQVMEDYWSSYLKGDLQTWASYLPDYYRNIGTTMSIVNSRASPMNLSSLFFKAKNTHSPLRGQKTQPSSLLHILEFCLLKMMRKY